MKKTAVIHCGINSVTNEGLERLLFTVKTGKHGTGTVIAKFEAWDTWNNNAYIIARIRGIILEATLLGYEKILSCPINYSLRNLKMVGHDYILQAMRETDSVPEKIPQYPY